jgi:hypothetical protein
VGERITVVLDDGTSSMLVKLAGSSRRQGEYLSKLIKAAWGNEIGGSTSGMDREIINLQVAGLAGQVKALDGRLMRVEQELIALKAR